MKKEIIERPQCSKCNSKLIYIRIKDKQRVCRSCGFVEDLKDLKKGKFALEEQDE